ncbi:MAG: glycoside hydrolase family 130 protein [Bacillota bacterium]|nr:glycoside hydrolase family 130 protein [Bacillota bacterium]
MARIIGESIPNIPWQDRPAGCQDVMWRYDKNPVIKRDLIRVSNSIFNSAVVTYEGKFAGVFRCDNRAREMNIFAGRSDDGYNWVIDEEPIEFQAVDEAITKLDYRYDPRVVWIEDRYWVSWCNGYHGPTIGMGYTNDFKTFYQIENAYLPYNRNGVLFPRKIGGNYLMLSRPSDTGHTPFGDIFISQSPDMIYWGKHRFVFGAYGDGWQSKKVGAGPIPIETSEGWLMIYHGVLNSCNGFVYSFGAALLDLDEPWKVIRRSRDYLIAPWMNYECVGDVPNVTFPCAALVDQDTGRLAVYYGCADTVTGLAFAYVDDILAWLETHSYES